MESATEAVTYFRRVFSGRIHLALGATGAVAQKGKTARGILLLNPAMGAPEPELIHVALKFRSHAGAKGPSAFRFGATSL